jgi:hypothetical protein
MNSRPWCLALLLASGSPLPAQQDLAALPALCHTMDSKPVFTTGDWSRWQMVNDVWAHEGVIV